MELRKAGKRVQNNWIFWKPVACGILTFTEAGSTDMDTLLEANVVADMKYGAPEE